MKHGGLEKVEACAASQPAAGCRRHTPRYAALRGALVMSVFRPAQSSIVSASGCKDFPTSPKTYWSPV
jgi:hypothetical protein